MVTQFHFKLIIAMLFSYGYVDNEINNDKKCRQITDDIDHHATGAIRHNPHCPMKCIRGFMQSH